MKKHFLLSTFLCYLSLLISHTLTATIPSQFNSIENISSIQSPTPSDDPTRETITPENGHDNFEISPYSCQLTGECTCHAIGECEPCDMAEMESEKYCAGYGNKEPVECNWSLNDPPHGNSTDGSKGTLPKFQSCKRVKKLEKIKYFEFQFVNMFVAFLSCAILIYRRLKLSADGYRKLVSRIAGNI
ncbi:13557_t:CDS:2 [Acaulospora morrowiae]|uniref:13557_t:CDS:1 n=1 Tax=Acaulospora morrowiae TaxID=94023 RepID=A0A9N9IJN3_9GLOM|nr:13557_t:CDS:2 [Acaulospora morrowiae]